tara:strand:+ start:549 stop:1013 length:465 start_codon:yes stop_codon:yes gene_type:complete
MGDWVIINQLTGNPEQILSVNSKADFEEAGWYKGTGKLARDLPEGYSAEDILEKSYYIEETSEWKTRSVRPTGFYDWTENKKWEIDNDRVMSAIRYERNNLLQGCDWTQLPDSPLTDEKKAEWATYRQSLRDVTKDVSSELDTLDGFAWPTAPS